MEPNIVTHKETAAIKELVSGTPVVRLKDINETQHQRRLLKIIRTVSDYIAGELGHSHKEEFWDRFEEWIKENKSTCRSYATVFTCKYIKDREGNDSVNQLVNYLLIAFNKWGIEINDELALVIKNKKRKWDADAAKRTEGKKRKKSEQYVNIKEHLQSFVRYTGSTSAGTFREHVKKARSLNKDVNNPFNKTTLIELNTVSNLKDDQITKLLLKVRAFFLVSKVTGLRWVSFLRMTRDNVTWREGSMLIKYKKKHNSKEIYEHVAVVPNVIATDCAILAYAQYVTSVPECENPFGYSHGTLNSKARARVAAIMELVAWASGSEGGIGYKKVHAMRSYCSSLLAERKVGTNDRHEHLGWSAGGNAIEKNHYLDGAIPALNSRVPMIAAGRANDEPAPAFWELLETTDDIWHNIAILSVAAKVSPINFCETAPDALTIKVQRHMIEASKMTVKTQQQLYKELSDLRKENMELRRVVQLYKDRLGENAPNVEETKEDVERRLSEIIKGLVSHTKEDTFPRQCLVTYNDVIEPALTAHPESGFIIKFSSGIGKSYQAVLVIAARQRKDPIGLKTLFEESSSKSWVSWVRMNRGTIAILNEVPLSTPMEYKQYYINK